MYSKNIATQSKAEMLPQERAPQMGKTERAIIRENIKRGKAEISMEDLLSEIRAVGRSTSKLEHVLEDSMSRVERLDSHIASVESFSEVTHNMARDTKEEVLRLRNELSSIKKVSVRAEISPALLNELKVIRNNIERQEGYSR